MKIFGLEITRQKARIEENGSGVHVAPDPALKPVYTRPERPSRSESGTPSGVYVSPNGMVRVRYRTKLTAADSFSRAFLLDVDEAAPVGSQSNMDPRKLGRWVLETFCIDLVTRPDESSAWGEPVPFTWAVLETLEGVYAEDGWPALLSFDITVQVIGKHMENLEALKKTSMSATGTSTSDGNPAVPRSPS